MLQKGSGLLHSWLKSGGLKRHKKHTKVSLLIYLEAARINHGVATKSKSVCAADNVETMS